MKFYNCVCGKDPKTEELSVLNLPLFISRTQTPFFSKRNERNDLHETTIQKLRAINEEIKHDFVIKPYKACMKNLAFMANHV